MLLFRVKAFAEWGSKAYTRAPHPAVTNLLQVREIVEVNWEVGETAGMLWKELVE